MARTVSLLNFTFSFGMFLDLLEIFNFCFSAGFLTRSQRRFTNF